MRKFFLYWFPPISYCVLIFFLSSKPTVGSSHDKTAHLVAYALMGILFSRAFASRLASPIPLSAPQVKGARGRIFLFSFLISTFYGITDEIHQKFVPGRHASLEDVVADALGALLGGLLYVAYTRLSKFKASN